MSELPDPRLHAFRPDLADQRLKDRVFSARYTTGMRAKCRISHSSLRRRPDFSAPQDSEILMGEWVRIFEWDEKWAWLQSEEDGYVGYAPAGDFMESHHGIENALHVNALNSFIFSEPDIKSRPVTAIYAGARLNCLGVGEKFYEVVVPDRSETGFIVKQHASLNRPEAGDLSKLPALLYGFMDTPYLWGGRTRAGLDCSGLVQQAFYMAGFAMPLRDADMQEASMGTAIPHKRTERSLKLGDLVFWPGHVGIMLDEKLMIHANATDMKVSIAPLDGIEDYILSLENNPVRCIKRI